MKMLRKIHGTLKLTLERTKMAKGSESRGGALAEKKIQAAMTKVLNEIYSGTYIKPSEMLFKDFFKTGAAEKMQIIPKNACLFNCKPKIRANKEIKVWAVGE
jgi:hypothetical protein